MHDEGLYQITFSGQCIAGCTHAEVKANLEQLFKSSTKTIEQLFSGKTIIIKKGLNEKKALAYQKAMHKAGALAEVTMMNVESPIDLAPPVTDEDHQPDIDNNIHDDNLPSPPASAISGDNYDDLPSPPPADITNARGPLGIAPADQWAMDPLGSRMSKPKKSKKRRAPATDHIHLSPPKTEPGQARRKVEKLNPDTSHLNLADSGARLSSDAAKETIDIPDLSHLQVSDVGDDMGQEVQIKDQLNPDISQYSLADSTENIPQIKHKKQQLDPDIAHLSLDDE